MKDETSAALEDIVTKIQEQDDAPNLGQVDADPSPGLLPSHRVGTTSHVISAGSLHVTYVLTWVTTRPQIHQDVPPP